MTRAKGIGVAAWAKGGSRGDAMKNGGRPRPRMESEEKAMRKTHGAIVLGLLVVACGGGADEAPPVAAPPPPSAAPAPPPPPAEPTAAAAPPAPKASQIELEQATLKAFAESFTDAKKLAALYADDAQMWVAGMGEFKGREAIQGAAASMHDAMTNVKFAFNREWFKGDMVAVEWTVNATQSKEWMGVPATEKPWGVTGASILWFDKDGHITKDHRYADSATIMGQLGVTKKKARAIPPVPSSTEVHVAKGDAQEDKALEWLKSVNGAFDKHDSKAFLDTMSDDTLYDDMSMAGQMKGKGAAKQFFESFTKAFPDMKLDVANAFAVEDFAIQEYVINGTHKAPLISPEGTIPATKKTVALHALDVMQVKDGKMAHGWTYANGVEFATQLGLVPPHGAKGDKASDKAGDKGADKGMKPAPAAKPAGAMTAPPAKK